MGTSSDYGQHVEAPEDRLIGLLLSVARARFWVALVVAPLIALAIRWSA